MLPCWAACGLDWAGKNGDSVCGQRSKEMGEGRGREEGERRGMLAEKRECVRER